MICLCASTRRAARLLTQLYEEALRPANLTPGQFEILATLGHRPGLSQSALANELALDQTTLSRNLRPLIARELLGGTVTLKDRRKTTYMLTSVGREALAGAMPLWQSVHQQMQYRLTDQWQSTLNTLAQLSTAVS